MIYEGDFSKFTKGVRNPRLLEGLQGKTFRTVNSSPDTKQILKLDFNSQADGSTMNWHLLWNSQEMVSSAISLPRLIGKQELDGRNLVSAILSHLNLLKCWSRLNGARFSRYTITIDPKVAEEFPQLNAQAVDPSGYRFILAAGEVE